MVRYKLKFNSRVILSLYRQHQSQICSATLVTRHANRRDKTSTLCVQFMNLMQKVCENEKLYPAELYTDVRAADKRTTRSNCCEPLVGKFEISRHLMFDQLQ